MAAISGMSSDGRIDGPIFMAAFAATVAPLALALIAYELHRARRRDGEQ